MSSSNIYRRGTTTFYLVMPVVLFVTFFFIFRNYQEEVRIQRQKDEQIAAIEQAKAAEEQKKRDAEVDAEQTRIRQLREEATRAKEEGEVQKRMQERLENEERLANTLRSLNEFGKQIDEVTAKLQFEREKRSAQEKEVWSRSVEVEKIRIEKNKTDLKGQYMVDNIIDRVNNVWIKQAAAMQAAAEKESKAKN